MNTRETGPIELRDFEGEKPRSVSGPWTRSAISGTEASIKLGPNLKQIRQSKNWTLEQASHHTGVAKATLSKIENSGMSPTFDILQRIVRGFQIDISELFDCTQSAAPRGRRTITRNGQGRSFPAGTYQHELLCTELVHKKLLPFRATIVARSLDQFTGWARHEGEEFLMVLEGQVAVHTEYYEPAILDKGDSMYFDSQMGHALLSTSPQDAEVIWVCIDLQRFETGAALLSQSPK